MIGLGTLINTGAVVAGGLIGLAAKGGLKQRFQDTLMQGLGLVTMFIGAAGAMKGMLTIVDGGLDTQGSFLLILSFVVGALAGEALNIEGFLERAGERLKARIRRSGDARFVDGFVTSSLVICVGAMGLVGSLQDGMTGDASTLIAKAAIDFVIVLVFASTFGAGAVFSALPLLIYQGAITVFARLLTPFFTEELIANMSFVGSTLIFAVGVNMAFGKRFKVGNLVPAVLAPVLYQLFRSLVF